MWRVLSSRVVHRDRWVHLRADDCVAASGARISPYYVLEYADFVHAVVLDDTDHVVLVRQYRHGLGLDCLELPGGISEAGESPVQTAVREVAEETGYEGASVQLVETLSVDPAKLANRLHVVLMTGATLVRKPRADGIEDITVVRVSISEAVSLALSGEISNASHVGILLIGLGAAGRMHYRAVGIPHATPIS